jgi:hypothetical protein
MKIDAMSTLVKGLQRQEVKVEKAARDINATAVAQQNAIAAATQAPDNGDVLAVNPTAAADVAAVTEANTRAAAVASDGDMVRPLVDLLEARTAYKATVAAMKVTADVEVAVTDLVGKRKDI